MEAELGGLGDGEETGKDPADERRGTSQREIRVIAEIPVDVEALVTKRHPHGFLTGLDPDDELGVDRHLLGESEPGEQGAPLRLNGILLRGSRWHVRQAPPREGAEYVVQLAAPCSELVHAGADRRRCVTSLDQATGFHRLEPIGEQVAGDTR